MNRATFKLLILVFVSFLFSNVFADGNIPNSKLKNYDEIYDSLEEPNFEYIFGIDPYQADDYTKYMRSPYPLFRTGVNLIFKSKTIPPGYYLLTPREKFGKTWILFKENGRASYVIPVYEESIVPEGFYEQKFPHEIPTKTQSIRDKTMNFIGKKWGKRNQRTPIPKSYVEFNDEGAYWDMILYYNNKKYRILFLKDL